MGKIKLMWTDKTNRIGRTLQTLEQISELLDTEYREVELRGAIKEFFVKGEMYIKFDPEELIEALYFITEVPICFIPTTRDAPCYITSKRMTGGVVIAPVVSGEDG